MTLDLGTAASTQLLQFAMRWREGVMRGALVTGKKAESGPKKRDPAIVQILTHQHHLHHSLATHLLKCAGRGGFALPECCSRV